MLHELLSARRSEIVASTAARIAAHAGSTRPREDIEGAATSMFEALLASLRPAASGPAPHAASHADDLFVLGFGLEHVVRDHAAFRQALLDLAGPHATPDEVAALHARLDEAIAATVAEHSRLGAKASHEEQCTRLGDFAHDLRNEINAVMLACAALRAELPDSGNGHGTAIDRSLMALRRFLDGSLSELRAEDRGPRAS